LSQYSCSTMRTEIVSHFWRAFPLHPIVETSVLLSLSSPIPFQYLRGGEVNMGYVICSTDPPALIENPSFHLPYHSSQQEWSCFQRICHRIKLRQRNSLLHLDPIWAHDRFLRSILWRCENVLEIDWGRGTLSCILIPWWDYDRFLRIILLRFEDTTEIDWGGGILPCIWIPCWDHETCGILENETTTIKKNGDMI
jgi:hypothetical protein